MSCWQFLSIYRVFKKKCLKGFDIKFDISRLQLDLDIPSWTFFNCPFRVDLKNIHYFSIWWNLDWDICKLLQGGQFNHKYFVYFFIKRLSSNEYYGAVLSAHKRSVAFLDTKEQLRESCHGTMSTLECSWVLMSAPERSQVLTVYWHHAQWCLKALKSTH